MMVQDHVQTAQGFLEVADAEFAAGDNLQASEKMWGAASHAVMAVALQRDWKHGSHRDLKNAAETLSKEYDVKGVRRTLDRRALRSGGKVPPELLPQLYGRLRIVWRPIQGPSVRGSNDRNRRGLINTAQSTSGLTTTLVLRPPRLYIERRTHLKRGG